MNTTDDVLLIVLGELVAALRWHRERGDRLTITEALTAALDDWLSELDGSDGDAPITAARSADHTGDDLLEAMDRLERRLRSSSPSGASRFSAPYALAEAVAGWNAVDAAEHRRSEPLRHHWSIQDADASAAEWTGE